MMTPSFSRGQMIRDASLTEADLAEVALCRRDRFMGNEQFPWSVPFN